MALEGVPREQKMLKGHLPRVIYYPSTRVYEDNIFQKVAAAEGCAPDHMVLSKSIQYIEPM